MQFVIRNSTIQVRQTAYLRVFPRLRLLEIANCTIDVGKPVATQGLPIVATVATLRFYNNIMATATLATLIAFFESLLSFTRVVPGAEVDLSFNGLPIRDRSSEELAAFKQARVLSLRGNPILASAENVAAIFNDFTALEELNLGQTNLTAVPGIIHVRFLLHTHFSHYECTAQWVFKGNSALTKAPCGAALRRWMPLAHGERNVVYHIFYGYYDV